jgi:hypothetical protein
MRSTGKIGAIFLALVLTLGLGTAGAAASTKKSRVSSEVSLQSVGPDGAGGQVSSSRKVCRAQRQVSFYRVNSGTSVPSSEPVASTWTRGDGSWTVPGPLYTSQFFAVVQRKSAKSVTCLSAVSNARYWG